MDLKELESGVDPEEHWYYQSKKIIVHKYFKKLSDVGKTITLVDFGSGSGFFAIDLLKEFPNAISKVYLVDIGYTKQELIETKGKQVEKIHRIPQGTSDAVILFMDVLEHIEDDYGILEEIRASLGSNVQYFITVPAFQSLWSSHDEYLEHFRRYTIKTLTKLLNKNKMEINRSHYVFALLHPVALIYRKIIGRGREKDSSDLSPAPSWLNTLLISYHKLEMKFALTNRFFGLTCVAEGRFEDPV